MVKRYEEICHLLDFPTNEVVFFFKFPKLKQEVEMARWIFLFNFFKCIKIHIFTYIHKAIV